MSKGPIRSNIDWPELPEVIDEPLFDPMISNAYGILITLPDQIDPKFTDCLAAKGNAEVCIKSGNKKKLMTLDEFKNLIFN